MQVVVQVVGAAQEAEQEDESVGGPGDGPEQEQQQPAPPQRPLALQPHTVKLLKNIWWYDEKYLKNTNKCFMSLLLTIKYLSSWVYYDFEEMQQFLMSHL